MGTLRRAWHWAFGKHPPRPPDPERTVEAAWLPLWQAPMVRDLLVAEGIPAAMAEDFGLHLTMYSREPMARVFVTEDRKEEAQDLIEQLTGHRPAQRML